ncbi:MAG: UDP-N-acetylmuramoyl-L-alanyl-D-glutamate--2,6-diaminopimelate ligase [Chlamydiae bacterium]|nr:UDP-N-acetylmuramoyl-L-alanyl-D-glutamate--2,6-diaminopimelate ligase [Chlamydiota bacterium]
MKLKRVIKDIVFSMIKGSKEVEVLGISSHSKSVAPGFVFIAKKGKKQDGADFIKDAISAGAVAIVTDMYNPFYENVVQLIHPHVEEIEGALARNFYKDPSSDLFLVGITGTNGKTTTSYIVKHILDSVGPCGLIGTVEINTGAHRIASSLTTPDVVSNNKFLKEMVGQGCKSAVIEVTSIGIDQHRVDCLEFDVGVFTNLTEEHLDYHKDMQSYALVKKQFLEKVKEAVVLNLDSPYYDLMKKGISAQIYTYSVTNPLADFYAKEIAITKEGTSFTLFHKEKGYEICTKLIGIHNVENVIAASIAAHIKGLPIKRIVERLKTLEDVPGRLEQIDTNVYVDYAHTPDALEKALLAIRQLEPSRVIVVFGCGGDRDRFKRPMMAKIAETYADLCIVTSDNPRSEDPKKIIEEIISGFSKEQFIVEEDRKKAIELSLAKAGCHDIVLIAGKGHETGQIVGSFVHEFDDRLIIRELCQNTR